MISTLVNASMRKDELRVTLQSSLISLNPGEIQDSQSLLVSRQVNCQLIRNQGSFFVLDAAESIKYISPLKVIIKLNDKAKFHNGMPVTSYDVVASINYIIKSRNVFRSLSTWIKTIQIIDSKSIIFTLKKQTPQFLKVLSSTNYTIFKKEFIENAMHNKELWKSPLGCGGYKVSEFTRDHIRLSPVRQGLPIIFYLNKTNQINASELSKYDIVSINIIGKSTELNDFREVESFDPLQFYIGLNSKSKLWKNKYDRCDFLATLNIKNLLNSYGKPAIEATDLLPRGTLGYNINENFNVKIANIAKHNKKLTSKLISDPFCLRYLSVSIQEKYRSEYLNMIKAIYPNIQAKNMNNVQKFGTTFLNEHCDAFLFALRSNYYDGYEYLTIFEDNDANFSGIRDKNLSDQILKSQSISNPEIRAEEYQHITKKIGDLCIIRPLFTIPTKKIYIRKNLKTPNIGLVSFHQYYFGNIST